MGRNTCCEFCHLVIDRHTCSLYLDKTSAIAPRHLVPSVACQMSLCTTQTAGPDVQRLIATHVSSRILRNRCSEGILICRTFSWFALMTALVTEIEQSKLGAQEIFPRIKFWWGPLCAFMIVQVRRVSTVYICRSLTQRYERAEAVIIQVKTN